MFAVIAASALGAANVHPERLHQIEIIKATPGLLRTAAPVATTLLSDTLVPYVVPPSPHASQPPHSVALEVLRMRLVVLDPRMVQTHRA